MEHQIKGERIFDLSDKTSPDITPGRYKQLADLIRHFKPKTILETGTARGFSALCMSKAINDLKINGKII